MKAVDMCQLVAVPLGSVAAGHSFFKWVLLLIGFAVMLWPRVRGHVDYHILKHMHQRMGNQMDERLTRHFSQLRHVPRDASGNVVVLELGISSGPNIRFFPEGTHLIASDINRIGATEVAQLCEENGVVMERFLQAYAEDLSALPDSSVSAVVTSLVMCSMSDRDRAMQEIQRVLMPGGRYLFMEHIREHEGNWARLLSQMLIFPMFMLLFSCNCMRRHIDVITRHFALVDASHFHIPNGTKDFLFYTCQPHVIGAATKPAH